VDRSAGLVTSPTVSSDASGSPDGVERHPSLLRSTWTRAALVIAAVEAILIVVGVLPRWIALGIALGLVVVYFVYGRGLGNPSVRQGMWAVALSQGLVLLVPLALWIFNAVLVALLAIAAVVVLALIVVDR
jgi:hypothetical protein